MTYYKIQYHNKDEHIDDWYDYSDEHYDTKSEAYEGLLCIMQQKLAVYMHTDVNKYRIVVDKFRIISVDEQPVYTTCQFPATSGR